MSSRHRAREAALQILYRYDIATATASPIKQPHDGQGMLDELGRHFEHFKVPLAFREFAANLVVGTLKQLTQIDLMLEKHASNWKLTRMSPVDRNLLRMSVYEMLNFPEIPRNVTIDEAIELAKQFGTADSPAFVNGVLDAVAQANPVAT